MKKQSSNSDGQIHSSNFDFDDFKKDTNQSKISTNIQEDSFNLEKYKKQQILTEGDFGSEPQSLKRKLKKMSSRSDRRKEKVGDILL